MSDGTDNITVVTEELSASVTGLLPGVEYEAVVFAISPLNSTTEPSDTLTFTTNLSGKIQNECTVHVESDDYI